MTTLKTINASYERFLKIAEIEDVGFKIAPHGTLYVTLRADGHAIAVTREGERLIGISGTPRENVAKYVRSAAVVS